MIKHLIIIAFLAFFTANSLRIHRTSLTDFLTHEGVPSLFKNVNTESDEFQKLAAEQLNKINVAAGIPSRESKHKGGEEAAKSSVSLKKDGDVSKSSDKSTRQDTSKQNAKSSVSSQFSQ